VPPVATRCRSRPRPYRKPASAPSPSTSARVRALAVLAPAPRWAFGPCCYRARSEPIVDADTGFVYLGALYYDPTTGQLISRDPVTALPGAPYSYVHGNPLSFSGPLGLWGPREIGRSIKKHVAGVTTAHCLVNA
jgi:RHS repeat-associated protein